MTEPSSPLNRIKNDLPACYCICVLGDYYLLQEGRVALHAFPGGHLICPQNLLQFSSPQLSTQRLLRHS